MKDCFIILYNKDNVLYPVGLSNDENDLIQLAIASVLNYKVVLDFKNPQGSPLNLRKGGMEWKLQ